MTDRDRTYLLKELTRTIDESDSTAAFCLCQRWILKDTLDLLKEQEPIALSVCGEPGGDSSWWYLCSKCGKPIDHKDRFCKQCGQAVKWDA